MGYDRNILIERINQLKKENRARVKAGEPVKDLSTNQKLSEVFKVSEKTIRNWLNKNPKNKIDMSIDDLVEFSELFECDINYLLGNIEQKTQIVTDVVKVTGLDPIAAEFLIKCNDISKNYMPKDEETKTYFKILGNFLVIINKLLDPENKLLFKMAEFLINHEIINETFSNEYYSLIIDLHLKYRTEFFKDSLNEEEYIKSELLKMGYNESTIKEIQESTNNYFEYYIYHYVDRDYKNYDAWSLSKDITDFLNNLV